MKRSIELFATKDRTLLPVMLREPAAKENS